MIETKIENWGLDKIKPGKSNPRTDFNEEALAELSESVATHGILQPLVTRPDWCIGKSPAEIAQINGNAPATNFLEIVAGERRFRAALKAKLETAPVSIRLFSDQDVLEIHLIENLQRENLDPFEEAAGYRQLLDLKDASGGPVHTVKSIAGRVHKDRARVYHRMKLLNVPASMRSAVSNGRVSVRVAEMGGEIPTKEMREAFAAEVLKPTDPKYGVGPLTVLQARELIETRFNRQLSAAQFDQKDPTLVAVIQDDQTGERIGGGACTDCPRRTGNMEDVIGKTKRPDVCTNPQCFSLKTDAHFARLMESAVAEGKKILTTEEAAAVFEPDGSIWYDCDYVKLSDQPDPQQVRADHTGKLPTWKKLIDGLEAKPQLYIARDPRGRIVELVKSALAIEAVNLAAKEKKETSIFDKTSARAGSTSASSSSAGSSIGGSTGGGGGGGLDPFKEQERKNREIAKVNFQITLASLSALIAAVDTKGMVKGFWDELIKASITHAGHDGCWLICKRHGLDPKIGKWVEGIASEGVEGAALEYGLTLPDEKMKIGYVVELLISQRVKFSGSGSMGGIKSVKTFTSFAKLYGVDLAAVEKETRASAKEKKKPKSTETPAKSADSAGKSKTAGSAKSSTPKAAIVDPSQVQLEGAYSAPEISKGTIRQPVLVEGKEYTVTGINFGAKGEKPVFDLAELVAAEKFKGKTRDADAPSPKKGPKGHYYGVAIKFHGKDYVLGFTRQYRLSAKAPAKKSKAAPARTKRTVARTLIRSLRNRKSPIENRKLRRGVRNERRKESHTPLERAGPESADRRNHPRDPRCFRATPGR
jgi:ParB/RepB/Spo0J family partition protein